MHVHVHVHMRCACVYVYVFARRATCVRFAASCSRTKLHGAHQPRSLLRADDLILGWVQVPNRRPEKGEVVKMVRRAARLACPRQAAKDEKDLRSARAATVDRRPFDAPC